MVISAWMCLGSWRSAGIRCRPSWAPRPRRSSSAAWRSSPPAGPRAAAGGVDATRVDSVIFHSTGNDQVRDLHVVPAEGSGARTVAAAAERALRRDDDASLGENLALCIRGEHADLTRGRPGAVASRIGSRPCRSSSHRPAPRCPRGRQWLPCRRGTLGTRRSARECAACRRCRSWVWVRARAARRRHRRRCG